MALLTTVMNIHAFCDATSCHWAPVVLKFSKDSKHFIFEFKQSCLLELPTQNRKALWPFEPPATTVITLQQSTTHKTEFSGILQCDLPHILDTPLWDVTDYKNTNHEGATINTAIPRLTSDPANEFFRLTKIFFAVSWTRLTNVLMDARANIKQQTWTVGPFRELIFFRLYVCDKEMFSLTV